MRKYVQVLFLCVFLIGLTALPAMAVDLRNVSGNSFGTGTSTGNSYRIALEAYSNAAGVSTIADDGTHKGQIRVFLTQPLAQGDTVNLKIDPANINAKFQATQSYKYGLCDSAFVVGGVCTAGGIVGAVPTAGIVTDNLSFGITASFIGAPTTLYVVQWNDVDNDNQITLGEAVLMGAGLSVNAGLGASCTSFPLIKIVFTTPHESTQTPQIFAFITPEFSVAPNSGPRADTFNAELDTDFDFMQFVLGSGPFVMNAFDIADLDSSDGTPNFGIPLFMIVDNATPLSVNFMWIAFVSGTPTGSIAFDVVSSVVEDAVEEISYGDDGTGNDGVDCTTTDNKTWHCNSGSVALTGTYGLEVELWGDVPANPTVWSIVNSRVLPTNMYCISSIDGPLGTWFGGVEVLVPFVKEGNGYDTTIKLFNRYKNDAKLYVKTFKGDSNSIIVAKDPLPSCTKPAGDVTTCDVIAADGSIVIKAADIAAFCPTCDMANGIPVKFLVRVPTQTGTTTSAGTYGTGTSGTTAATLTHQNPKDPYIEGIVVQQVPGGQQRSIPLEFKAFKQGEYNQ